MKNTLDICCEYITGAPISSIMTNLVDDTRFKVLKSQIKKESLESLCMNFCEIDILAAKSLREQIVENIDVTIINSFLWEYGFFSNLEQRYGKDIPRDIDVESESFAAYISCISEAMSQTIIKKHVIESIQKYYDADEAFYHRAKIYMESGYISQHFFHRISDQLGKTFYA